MTRWLNTDVVEKLSPGIPILGLWEAENVIVFKRSMAAGYAGVQNPLFCSDKSQMLFGGDKPRVEDVFDAF